MTVTKKTKRDIAVKFHGEENVFISGIPSKDLTATEWGLLPDGLKKKALASGLYSFVNKEKKDA